MSQSLKLFEELIDPIERRMIDSIWRIVRNKHDFDDAFQQALATIWKRLDKVSQHPHPPACVLRICVNAAYDVLRKQRRQREQELSLDGSDGIVDPVRDGAQSLQGKEKEDEIMSAISQLPEAQADAVLMRFSQDASYADIARALECSEAAARQHVCRAREKLVGILRPLFPPSTQGSPS